MAATGVTVSDDVISQFNEVKLGRIKAKYIIYKIDGEFWIGLGLLTLRSSLPMVLVSL